MNPEDRVPKNRNRINVIETTAIPTTDAMVLTKIRLVRGHVPDWKRVIWQYTPPVHIKIGKMKSRDSPFDIPKDLSDVVEVNELSGESINKMPVRKTIASVPARRLADRKRRQVNPEVEPEEELLVSVKNTFLYVIQPRIM